MRRIVFPIFEKKIFALVAGIGSCGWWSTSTPIASTTDFSGCGVSHMSHPFGHAGICGRPPSPHLRLPQPRRSEWCIMSLAYAFWFAIM